MYDDKHFAMINVLNIQTILPSLSLSLCHALCLSIYLSMYTFTYSYNMILVVSYFFLFAIYFAISTRSLRGGGWTKCFSTFFFSCNGH